MSSSYFDAQPAKAPPPAALLDIPEGSGLANTSFLSPQVSRILEDLELDEKSSSEDQDENASLSGDSNSDKDISRDRKSRRGQAEHDYSNRKTQTSPLPRGSKTHNKPSSHRPGFHSQKNPHLARFHSLRSMLFSSQIEDNIQKENESKMQAQAEAKWRAEHDLRKGLNRPKTPESQTPPREGLTKRMTSGLKRMASKNSPPPMARIAEDNVSTASDDEQEEASHSNEEEINHSDIEDLVRWVSRRDPPSDGETRRVQGDTTNNISKTDSGHESLGHSDVEDLVRWVSRKDEKKSEGLQKTNSEPKALPAADTVQHTYTYDSDASTESDPESGARPAEHRDSITDDDVDNLVRWVSRKEGPNAGPVCKKKESSSTGTPTGSEAQVSNTEELVRWVTKQDDTSGESDNASNQSPPDIAEHAEPTNAAPRRGSALKREVSHTQPAAMESTNALTHDDVDDLVQWLTRKNPDIQEVEKRDDGIFE
ncbi:hypothetical protein P171DRAFT_187858 [Karstenula rhodostoma CBS 690.94]|uniref:Uncharacterized protein n=1 Tax=Karstenula rhodostoma CBS 690.94 TaxID=1392251 RepID=A0A9P4PQ10_9PLEO|nr:hypothetical protein P171DRAFT_187858 [Karstenula rhodostoma CBS 690.94]